jgi:Glu-tRNA(Gln) amidotransferase subunit E-like FAD-binding protein
MLTRSNNIRIKKNYELSSDTSSDLPKEQVYRHYREFCEETGVQQTNCATFGKILRSVFPNLKTRRLGSRGNTKHHYHGIRRRSAPPAPLPCQFQSRVRLFKEC